jgi:prophage maintenance system killer protein
MAALEAIDRFAGRNPVLGKSLVLEVHRLSCPPEGGAFRRGPVRKPFSSAEPPRPALISDQVDNLMEWLAAESAKQMHVVEKAALAFARLMEISPFETGNFRTAHLLLNYFSSAEGFPPLFLRLEEAEELRGDIKCAMRFDTGPLVYRLSEALARSLASCMDATGDVASSAGADERGHDAGTCG